VIKQFLGVLGSSLEVYRQAQSKPNRFRVVFRVAGFRFACLKSNAGRARSDGTSLLRNKEQKMAAKQMTKSQIAAHFADKFGLSKKTAGEIIDEYGSLAVAQTKKQGQFTIPGVGKLVKAARKARMGRNPATGAAIKIPAKTVVKFRVAKAAKDAVVPAMKKK